MAGFTVSVTIKPSLYRMLRWTLEASSPIPGLYRPPRRLFLLGDHLFGHPHVAGDVAAHDVGFPALHSFGQPHADRRSRAPRSVTVRPRIVAYSDDWPAGARH